MLKKFWDENKHQIQLTGILIGAGALFLSIPVPENERAKEALLNIQFIWLIITTVATLMLMVSIYKLTRLFEAENNIDSLLDLDETVSVITFTGLVYFLVNIWVYAYSLYREAFFDFLGVAGYGLGGLLGAIEIFLLGKINKKFRQTKYFESRFYSTIFLMFVLALFSIPAGAVMGFIFRQENFSIQTWLYAGVLHFILFFGTILFAEFKKSKKTL